MIKKIPVLFGFLLFALFLFSAPPTNKSGKKEEKEKDPYIEISSELSSLANSIPAQDAKKQAATVEGKEATGNDEVNTDYLFKTYKVWQMLFKLHYIRDTVEGWYHQYISNGIFRDFFLSLVVIEIAILFFSGNLELGTFFKTLIYAAAIYIIIIPPKDNYYSIFWALHNGFEQITNSIATPAQWEKASHALIDITFVAANSSFLSMITLGVVALFLYIFLYFIYLPAITLPIIISNLLILGLFVLGRFALVFSILSVFRKFSLSFISFFGAVELYKTISVLFIYAIGRSLGLVTLEIFGDSGFHLFAHFTSALQVIIYTGPIAALFIALDVINLNIIRGIFTVLIFPARTGGGMAGVAAVEKGAKVMEKSAEAGAKAAAREG